MPTDGFYDIIQNLRKSYNLLPSYDQKRRLTIWRLSASFNYFIFFVLVAGFSLLSQSSPAYEISSKSDEISMKYGDITIFKMANVRHLGFPNFETFHIRLLLLSDLATL